MFVLFSAVFLALRALLGLSFWLEGKEGEERKEIFKYIHFWKGKEKKTDQKKNLTLTTILEKLNI